MSSRRSTFLPSLAALGALSCQPVLDSEVPGSSPYLISQETPQGAAIVLDPDRRPRRFREAPMLARLVARGKLPPVEERLPENPLVLQPIESIGRYGGTVQSGMIAKGLNEEMNRIMGMEKFLFYDAAGTRIVPSVAEDWRQSEDGRRLRIHLRRGMRWSDGHPFTAEDVRFYWEDLNAHPDVFPFPDPDLVVNGKPIRFQVLDPHTVLFRFDDPYHRLLEIVASAFSRFAGGVFGEFLWGPYAPAHYLKQFHPRYVSPEDLQRKVRESQQEDWVGLMKLRNNYALNTQLPVLMPWRTVQARDSSAWILERNPYFWEVDTEGNQLPYIDRWVLTKAADREVVNLRAIAGEYDFQFRGLDLQNLPVFLEHAEEENYNIHLDPSLSRMLFGCYFNLAWEGDAEISRLLRNANFRRALSLGLRRSQFSDAFYFSLASPGAAGPGSAHLEHPGKSYLTLWSTYDPDRANAMLDNLGLEGAGRRRIPDPKRRPRPLANPDSGALRSAGGPQIPDVGAAARSTGHRGGRSHPGTDPLVGGDAGQPRPDHLLDESHPVRLGEPAHVCPSRRPDFPHRSPFRPLVLQQRTTGKETRRPADSPGPGALSVRPNPTCPERTRIAREIWGIAIREQWMMSTVGGAPGGVRLAHRRLGNVPARLCARDVCRYPSTGRLETLYWKE